MLDRIRRRFRPSTRPTASRSCAHSRSTSLANTQGSAHAVPNAQITPRSAHAPATTRASIPPDVSPSLMPENPTAERIRSSTLIYNCSTNRTTEQWHSLEACWYSFPSMRTTMPKREFDVVLYGATGFTGRQTVRYFAEFAPPDLKWAIAGRNLNKLQALKCGVPVIVADSSDQTAIDAMVTRTRVLLTTAGPFALHGTGIVDACVRLRAHYCYITGETPW